MPFTSLDLHASLLRGLKELGFTRPTPIQAEAIPPAMAGRDVLACASTGSGKTAAFLLPIVHKLLDRPRGATRALVITPTRELAAQIVADLGDIAVHTPIRGAAVFGGVGMGPQEHAFRSGVDIIVATPGRLLDHFRARYATLSSLEFLVLDEADRMLDMGFLPDIRRVLKHIPTKRQTLFFSATMPPPIALLTRDILKDPVTISLQRTAAPAAGITQAVYPVGQDLKASLLLSLLTGNHVKDALVFTRTKHRADRVARYLVRHGIKAERIHGNRSQPQRTAALAGFKDGTFRVLVATDIAARGIDVEALGHVVNFDVPMVPEDYIHRVGRTGRAEMTGDAFTFVSQQEEGDLRDIEKAIGRRLPRVTLPDFDYATPIAEPPAPPSAAPAHARPSGGQGRGRQGHQQQGRPGGNRGGSGAGQASRESRPAARPGRPRPAGGHQPSGQGQGSGRPRSGGGAPSPGSGGRPPRRRSR